MKVEKCLDYAYGLMMYASLTTFAIYNYWGSPDITYLIGGKGENDVLYKDWPYSEGP